MTGDRFDEAIVQPAADAAVDRRGRRLIVVFGVLTAMLIVAGLTSFLIDRSQRIHDVSALAQQVRDLGGTPVVQVSGVPGPEGQAGRDGRDGTDGRDGRDGTTPPCLSEPSQCRGADGTPGAEGQDGQDGADGTNGTNGADGKDGRDGIDGQPPAGWTWTDGDGREQSCARNVDSPDTAPTYKCTAPSSGPPGTTTTSPPLLRRR